MFICCQEIETNAGIILWIYLVIYCFMYWMLNMNKQNTTWNKAYTKVNQPGVKHLNRPAQG